MPGHVCKPGNRTPRIIIIIIIIINCLLNFMLLPYFKNIFRILTVACLAKREPNEILTGGRIFLGILLYECQFGN